LANTVTSAASLTRRLTELRYSGYNVRQLQRKRLKHSQDAPTEARNMATASGTGIDPGAGIAGE